MRSLLWLMLPAALVAAGPGAADWLVTSDGGRIETKGPWKVDGRRVLFTQPNGTLASLRLDDVDLDRSALETQRARETATAPPPPEKKAEPVLRLTERDLPPVRESEEAPTKEADAAAKAVDSGLQVAHWERAETAAGDGIELFGTVKNGGNANVTSPTLMVTLYDADGRLIATSEGKVNAPAIPPGQTASFRAVFPGIDDFAAARFDPQGTPFATRDAEQGEEGEASAAEEMTPVPGVEAGAEAEEPAPPAEEEEGGAPPPNA